MQGSVGDPGMKGENGDPGAAVSYYLLHIHCIKIYSVGVGGSCDVVGGSCDVVGGSCDVGVGHVMWVICTIICCWSQSLWTLTIPGSCLLFPGSSWVEWASGTSWSTWTQGK